MTPPPGGAVSGLTSPHAKLHGNAKRYYCDTGMDNEDQDVGDVLGSAVTDATYALANYALCRATIIPR